MKNPQWSFTHEDALECGIIIIIIICRNFNHFFKLWRIGPSMWPSYASKTTLQNWLKFLQISYMVKILPIRKSDIIIISIIIYLATIPRCCVLLNLSLILHELSVDLR